MKNINNKYNLLIKTNKTKLLYGLSISYQIVNQKLELLISTEYQILDNEILFIVNKNKIENLIDYFIQQCNTIELFLKQNECEFLAYFVEHTNNKLSKLRVFIVNLIHNTSDINYLKVEYYLNNLSEKIDIYVHNYLQENENYYINCNSIGIFGKYKFINYLSINNNYLSSNLNINLTSKNNKNIFLLFCNSIFNLLSFVFIFQIIMKIMKKTLFFNKTKFLNLKIIIQIIFTLCLLTLWVILTSTFYYILINKLIIMFNNLVNNMIKISNAFKKIETLFSFINYF